MWLGRGQSRGAILEVNVGRKSTNHTRVFSTQVLGGTVQPGLRRCSQSPVPLEASPLPKGDPHSTCIFMMSGVCSMHATSVLCLAFVLES